jgi:transposase
MNEIHPRPTKPTAQFYGIRSSNHSFVMVLSWSRQIFLRFYLNAAMPSFLRGHVEAFAFLGGVARTLQYDNLKSVVLERIGDAIRFNPTLLELAAHYRFAPRPVAVARGNEKGYASHCTSFERFGSTLGKRNRLESFRPWALTGGSLPGCSYKHSFLSV